MKERKKKQFGTIYMTINKNNLAFFIDLKVSLMSSTQARCQVGNNLEIFPDGALWEAD